MQDVNLNHLHQICCQRPIFRLTMISEITKPLNLKLPKDRLLNLKNTSLGLSLAKKPDSKALY